MSISIEEWTMESHDALLAEVLDVGRSCTPREHAARIEIERLKGALIRIAHTEYGEDGQRQYPSSDELKKWARDALST